MTEVNNMYIYTFVFLLPPDLVVTPSTSFVFAFDFGVCGSRRVLFSFATSLGRLITRFLDLPDRGVRGTTTSITCLPFLRRGVLTWGSLSGSSASLGGTAMLGAADSCCTIFLGFGLIFFGFVGGPTLDSGINSS